ncbi:response regulator [Paenibacillus sp. LHD-38]|uniref:response regulator transcription factor n=1 Tax=Paenibacillus sp. LHD-38 TaxID=3072143 RepID=UPI00280DFAD2|nr:response regulator [Paenibacillus sp. LHD-38]MDQ8734188.1 response regulator [Paenibacillus sp. LHD-38]
MKALIIDDEKHVREAIRLLVPWDQFGIDTLLEAQDGASATGLIRAERPEIIFTDMMMPNMDGRELLQWTAEHAPASKIIVISGHDDFSFVRHAVKYGGVDYILKPIDAEQLVSALTKAVNSWTTEEQERTRKRKMNIELNQLKPMYLEQYFSTMINEPGTYPSFADTLKQELGITAPITRARIAIVRLDLTTPAVREKFAAGLDLLLFSLTNICNEFLKEQELGFALRHWGQDHELLLLFWGEGEQAPQLIQEINDAMSLALKTRFHFGLGHAAAFPEAAASAYQQAKLALLRRNLLVNHTYCHPFSSAAPSSKSTQQLFSEHEEPIRFAVLSGSKEQIRRALQPWFDTLDQAGCISLEQLIVWRQQYELAKSIWDSKNNRGSAVEQAPKAEDQALLPVDAHGFFDFEQWKHVVFTEACELSAQIAERDKERSVIEDIAEYIEQHPHEEITLQDISERFFLSREYISRKFKQETNGNLSDFIAEVRIKRAKELLANGQLKISQVAELVGFQDEKYFSRVFKKRTNCSPNDYRKHHFGGDS